MSEDCSIPPQSPTGGKYMIYLVRVMLLVGLQHDSSNTGSKTEDQNIIMKDWFRLSHCTISLKLKILICETCGLEWLLLAIWFRKRSAQCTKIDSPHWCIAPLLPVLSSWLAQLFSGEWEKANFTPICQNWSVNFPQLRWKILSSKPSTVEMAPHTQHREETKGWVSGKFGRKWFLNRLHLVRTTDEVRNQGKICHYCT